MGGLGFWSYVPHYSSVLIMCPVAPELMAVKILFLESLPDICLLFHVKIDSGIQLLKHSVILKFLAIRANKGKEKVTIMCQALY